MELKDVFVNKIEELNCLAKDLGETNFKNWAFNAFKNGKISNVDNSKILMYHDIRNIISHGGSGRITIYQEDIDFLDKYIAILDPKRGRENNRPNGGSGGIVLC